MSQEASAWCEQVCIVSDIRTLPAHSQTSLERTCLRLCRHQSHNDERNHIGGEMHNET